MEVKFSILMANYNNAKFVADAIESVLRQTYKDWELIVIDDCSTDSSVEIIQSYQDERINFYRNEKNIGKIGVLKKGVALASAEIVGILDSDDALAENALEEMIKAYREHPECGFIYSQFIFCDKNLNPVKRGNCKFMPQGRSNLFDLYAVAFRTYKKSCYYKTAGYDEEILYAEDRDIIFKMEEVADFYFVDKILYKYRRIPNSQTTDPVKAERSRISNALAKYNAYMRRQNSKMTNLTPREMSSQLLDAFFSCIKIKDKKRAKFLLANVARLCPFNIKGYAMLLFRAVKFPFYRIYRKLKRNNDALYGA